MSNLKRKRELLDRMKKNGIEKGYLLPRIKPKSVGMRLEKVEPIEKKEPTEREKLLRTIPF